MDHFLLGQTALEGRQFLEAEAHLRKAIPAAVSDQLVSLYEMLFRTVHVLRPEDSWREAALWLRCKAEGKQWKELLDDLNGIESHWTESHRDFCLELKAEALFHLGSYGAARTTSANHLEILQKKKLLPRLQYFSVTYRGRFPHTILFYYQEVSAAAQLQDLSATKAALDNFLSAVETRWNQLEDVTEQSREVLFAEVLRALDSFDADNGEANLLGHYLRLVYVREADLSVEKEDWKKAAELIIYEPSWRHWKIALELAIIADDSDLAQDLHKQIRSKRGFSFVKFTKNNSGLKDWMLKHGHDRSGKDEAANSGELLSEDDLALQGEAPVDVPRHLGEELLDEEERVVEQNAIKQLRLIAPPLAMVPDLIVTYEMLGFSRVVEWLVRSYDNCEDYPRIQKKIRYFSVLHDMKKENYHHALATIELMLGEKEISLDELKELKYAQAAIHHALGDAKKSKSMFAEIERIDPAYRRLRERTW